jgi:hypothetical protein
MMPAEARRQGTTTGTTGLKDDDQADHGEYDDHHQDDISAGHISSAGILSRNYILRADHELSGCTILLHRRFFDGHGIGRGQHEHQQDTPELDLFSHIFLLFLCDQTGLLRFGKPWQPIKLAAALIKISPTQQESYEMERNEAHRPDSDQGN